MHHPDTNQLLAAHGFQHQPNTNEQAWSIYLRPISSDWVIQARGDWREQRINIGLKPATELGRSSIGTVHRFGGHSALERDLQSVVAHLEGLAIQPSCLKCPTCQTRWVHLKEGPYHRPFLSCDGMTIAGRKPNRGPLCRGTSELIPALVEH